MKWNVSQFPLIRSRRVCVCCYPCRVKWLLEMLSGVRNSPFCSVSVRNQTFSWLVSHGGSVAMEDIALGDLWTSSQSVGGLLHVLCFCTASLLAPVVPPAFT